MFIGLQNNSGTDVVLDDFQGWVNADVSFTVNATFPLTLAANAITYIDVGSSNFNHFVASSASVLTSIGLAYYAKNAANDSGVLITSLVTVVDVGGGTGCILQLNVGSGAVAAALPASTPLTIAQLQANLIAGKNAEAANTVALMESIVDGRLSLVNVNIDDLAAKMAAVDALLDGDPNTPGFQTFSDLVSRIIALESTSATNASAITALQNSLSTLQSTLLNRITSIEGNVANLIAQAAALATQAGDYITRDEFSDDMQAGSQAFIDTLWAGKTRPHGLPNSDGSVS